MEDRTLEQAPLLQFKKKNHPKYFCACHHTQYKLLLAQMKCHMQYKHDKWFTGRENWSKPFTGLTLHINLNLYFIKELSENC